MGGELWVTAVDSGWMEVVGGEWSTLRRRWRVVGDGTGLSAVERK